MIVGIDEVGRGAWAGPLCVGAVALGDVMIEGLTDSKKLTAKKRERLTLEIKQRAASVGLGWVSAKVIDRIGLSAALKLAAARALSQISVPFDQVIIDGTIKLVDDPRVTTMKRADLLVPCVSAASIVAKVARDEYMKLLGVKFPGYGFEGHVGYGTAAHIKAIEELGATPVHRMSFGPLKQSQEAGVMSQDEKTGSLPTTRVIGNNAEGEAADYLKRAGYTIIDRNWKTKWCEIDIIAERQGVIHFVEVKYRKNDRSGSGLAAITPRKLKQMKFAAELWLVSHDAAGAVLSAVEVSGEEFVISEFIEVI